METEWTPVREGLLHGGPFRPMELVALRASRCRDCGAVGFPARSACEACQAEVEEIALSQKAILEAQTEVIHPPPDAQIPVPYGVGLVRFPEGVSIMGLLDDDLRQTDAIGSEVESFVLGFGESEVTYAFRRVASGDLP